MGILATGIRISPPNARFTGAAFGKGIYLSDMM